MYTCTHLLQSILAVYTQLVHQYYSSCRHTQSPIHPDSKLQLFLHLLRHHQQDGLDHCDMKHFLQMHCTIISIKGITTKLPWGHCTPARLLVLQYGDTMPCPLCVQFSSACSLPLHDTLSSSMGRLSCPNLD